MSDADNLRFTKIPFNNGSAEIFYDDGEVSS